MTDVEIEYCVPCGFRDRALTVEQAILSALETDIDELTLTMGEHGVFIVRVDGQPVYDKDEDHFDIDDIVRSVRQQV